MAGLGGRGAIGDLVMVAVAGCREAPTKGQKSYDPQTNSKKMNSFFIFLVKILNTTLIYQIHFRLIIIGASALKHTHAKTTFTRPVMNGRARPSSSCYFYSLRLSEYIYIHVFYELFQSEIGAYSQEAPLSAGGTCSLCGSVVVINIID